jgi:hypothetical protein
MSVKTALQLNALVGIASAMAATAMIWLVLTEPTVVASAVAAHDYAGLARSMAGAVAGWLRAVVHYL